MWYGGGGSVSYFRELSCLLSSTCVWGAALAHRTGLPVLHGGTLPFFVLPAALWRVPCGEGVWMLETLKVATSWGIRSTWFRVQIRLYRAG